MSKSEEFTIFGTELISYDGESDRVSIPSIVKEITFRAFYGKTICEVNIPQSVEFIDVQAFLCCNNLKFVVIPKSVKAMGFAVFEDCKNLTDIYFEAEKGTDLGFEWDYGCTAKLHWAGEWEWLNGTPKAK